MLNLAATNSKKSVGIIIIIIAIHKWVRVSLGILFIRPCATSKQESLVNCYYHNCYCCLFIHLFYFFVFFIFPEFYSPNFGGGYMNMSYIWIIMASQKEKN